MKDLLKDAIWAVVVIVTILALSSCRTIEGFADDVKSVASGTREYMVDH